MQQFLALTVAGIATYGCVYALTALGLVVTYTTSGIFNFAQGAVGMIGAFTYWEFEAHFHWPALAAFVFVGLVLSPLAGAALEWLLMRRVANATLEAKLTVTIGLLLFFLALAATVWNPSVARTVPQFFAGRSVSIGGVVLTYHQLTVVGVAVLVSVALRLFFYRTRPGIATRAVVDDRDLVALTGAVPARYAMLGWAMGSALASIAGILLAPTVNLDINTLTLLVINGYAAAVVGRLRSLPLTFLGAIVLGLIQSYAIGYLPIGDLWTSLGQIIPMLYLFLVILILPQTREGFHRQVRTRLVKVKSLRESSLRSAAFVVAAVVAAQLLSSSNLGYANKGLALGVVMLSFVLLTGLGGQISLCQLTLAGLGAFAMGKVGGSSGSALGLLAGIALAAGVGALIALPALRLRGLYLALATLSFAYAMDEVFFTSQRFFGTNDALNVARVHIPGISLASDRAYLIFEAVVFAIVSVGVLALRRAPFGRRLVAISDSPGASLSVGVQMTRAKLAVFAISSAIAGLGGALYGGAQGTVGPHDFAFLSSLTILMLAVVWGIRSVTGMLIGGVSLALGPLIQSHVSSPREIVQLLVGLAAIGIAQNPAGILGSGSPRLKSPGKGPRRSLRSDLVVAQPEESLTNAAS